MAFAMFAGNALIANLVVKRRLIEKMKKARLQTKLLVSFMTLALVPFAIVSIISLSKSSKALSSQAYSRLETIRGIKKSSIEGLFKKRQTDIGMLSETVKTLRKEAFSKLVAVREVKKAAIERYFQSIQDQIVTFSEDSMVVGAMKKFKRYARTFRKQNSISSAKLKTMRSKLLTYYTGEFTAEYKKHNENKSPYAETFFKQLDNDSIALQYAYISDNKNPLGSKYLLNKSNDMSDYSKFHANVHPVIRNFLDKFGYYDIFLVDSETGDIVYSVFKELDFSTSLKDGPYAKTNFGNAFRRANEFNNKDAFVLVDYAQYTPSYEEPASFIASPIFDGNKKIGVVMFQMPPDRLSAIMGERAGLGETGETYLVGQDMLMRSNSYFDPKSHSVSASFRNPEKGSVDTEAANAALSGEVGADVIVDYKNKPVLSAWAPIKFGNFTWALLSEIDVAEAFCPKDSEGKYYFEKYTKEYGFNDLYLIDSDGYCFYSVAKESDYQTNLLSGKYSTSNLGQLVKNVIKTQKFGISDFSPYDLDNGEPAAFIAQPITHNGGSELIVALKLSMEEINDIMGHKDGMGKTEETFLVGADYLMRSDSFLAPITHSVKASFANPSKGSVTWEGKPIIGLVRALVAGETGSQIITSYNGNKVLSSYTPIRVSDSITWALIAEVDEAEAFAPVKDLELFMGILAVVCTTAIIAIALMIARGIAKPIIELKEVANDIALGDLDYSINISRGDEIGELSESFQHMISEQREKVEIAKTIASKDLTATVVLASEKDELGKALQDMVRNLRGIISKASNASTQISSGSTQVASSSQSLSQGATEQAASIEEITSSMTEIASQTKSNAENASQGNQIAINARDAGNRGKEQMKEMVVSINNINESGKEISKIIKVIDDIAFQTNLLALNAAVEAARAGKHGKGFAVVAEEVRNLAGRSAKAAKETAELIEDSVKKAESGSVIANKTGKVLEEIAESSVKVADIVGEIAAASNEQAQGIAQINEGLSQIEQVTQQNTASSEETSAASKDLAYQATQLNNGLSTFKLGNVRNAPEHVQVSEPTQVTYASVELPVQSVHDEHKMTSPEDVISLDSEDFGRY